jgi:8-oxo-dGTP diphosphatase
VVAAFIERRGRVLLSQRRADQSFPLAWEFPGGKVEPARISIGAGARDSRGAWLHDSGQVDPRSRVHAYPDFDLIMPVYRATSRRQPAPCEVEAVAWVPRQRLVD